ncbi:hypothetical protein EUZ85_15020 [Hahella sp. KA22]|uniref:hypothetical protein n=1 Tax=unclassified Hahella TaxID=2624107 RepID=UPI000FDE89EB|nr:MULTISPECIES: hypothetical protein [unclassified Hahella]AZZ91972.1 hypothetical protein ENC22_12455 [Hahella sp. KA22]QAY55343.1 hypothetical protein EUZ85_15020 [Hahella sp. KA22]WLQ17015.1 hypothetical protein O5O45_13935 [Hahella sp. HNIBRBA332]
MKTSAISLLFLLSTGITGCCTTYIPDVDIPLTAELKLRNVSDSSLIIKKLQSKEDKQRIFSFPPTQLASGKTVSFPVSEKTYSLVKAGDFEVSYQCSMAERYFGKESVSVASNDTAALQSVEIEFSQCATEGE